MYKIAIWSLSKHFQNKVFLSIKNNKKIKINSILTKKKFDKSFRIEKKNWFNNENQFFKKINFDYVYISSINSNHYKNCKTALNNKVNVICEKPLCLNTNQLKKLIKISKLKKKKIFEVNHYIYHPLFIKIKKIIEKKKIGKILNVESAFKIPLFEKNNFRFKEELGGGALIDAGYYPISIMYNLFSSKKVKILKSKIIKKNGIDLKGNLISKNENNIIFNLSWGFKSNYENYLKIIGEKGLIKAKFIFSKQINQGGEIEIITQKREVIKIKKANQINLFFKKILTADTNYSKNKLKNTQDILKIINELRKK
jgi:NDP-hexose-3-ketoreductase